jgi:hypothetical protein
MAKNYLRRSNFHALFAITIEIYEDPNREEERMREKEREKKRNREWN